MDQLIFDFDGTITQSDTIGALVDASLSFHKSQGHDLTTQWEQVVKAYTEDLQTFKNMYEPRERDRTTLEAERRYLDAIHDIDESSVARVSASGIFNGLNEAHLFRFGNEAAKSGAVKLRSGFAQLVELAQERGWSIKIVSVNWSSAFIRGVLHPLTAEVISNDVEETSGRIRGPVILGKGLTSSIDKLHILNHLKLHGHTNDVVYFGDSLTDIECLLSKGIVIASDRESAFLQSLARIGLSVPHVSEQTSSDGTIVWATNFDEVIRSRYLTGQSDPENA